jgi:secreted Zn-dependent insulinase-like peptidase
VVSLGGAAGDKQEERDSEVHSKLQDFRHKHYVAESMTLAVQSTHDLDTLQNYVVKFFSKVPSSNSTKPLTGVQDENLKLPFDTDEFKKLYYVKPVKDVQEVMLIIYFSFE